MGKHLITKTDTKTSDRNPKKPLFKLISPEEISKKRVSSYTYLIK